MRRIKLPQIRKLHIISTGLAIVLVVTGFLVLSQTSHAYESKPIAAIALSDSGEAATKTPTKTPSAAPTPATLTPVSIDATSSPSVQTTTSTDDPSPTVPPYGPSDPNNSGAYAVYDTTTVMNEAGISPADQADADAFITAVSQWNYNGFLTLCVRNAGPSATPAEAIRASQAAFGVAVYTDAVVQLQWCQSYLAQEGLTWQTALAALNN